MTRRLICTPQKAVIDNSDPADAGLDALLVGRPWFPTRWRETGKFGKSPVATDAQQREPRVKRAAREPERRADQRKRPGGSRDPRAGKRVIDRDRQARQQRRRDRDIGQSKARRLGRSARIIAHHRS